MASTLTNKVSPALKKTLTTETSSQMLQTDGQRANYSSKVKLTKDNSGAITSSLKKSSARYFQFPTSPTEVEQRQKPYMLDPRAEKHTYQRVVPPTAAEILEQENLKLVNPSMVLLKHLRMHSDQPKKFRIKLIENVLQAKQQLGERVVDPQIKKNIGLINDFYLKLKNKVKTKKILLSNPPSQSKMGSFPSRDFQMDSQSMAGRSSALLVNERSEDHNLQSEDLSRPSGKPQLITDQLEGNESLSNYNTAELEQALKFLQKAPKDELRPGSRSMRASFSSRPSMRSGNAPRKKSMFGQKVEDDLQSKSKFGEDEADSTPMANQLAQKMKGEDKFTMEVNFLIKIIREAKKQAQSTPGSNPNANYMAILEKLKGIRIKTDQSSIEPNFETLCDTPLKKLKKHLESKKLQTKLEEVKTQKAAKRKKNRSERSIKLSNLLKSTRGDVRQVVNDPSHLRLNQLFSRRAGEQSNMPLLTAIAGEAKRETARHLVKMEPRLREEISPKHAEQMMFDQGRRIHDPFVETLRDEYYRIREQSQSDAARQAQLKQMQMRMSTAEFCGQSSDTYKSLSKVVDLVWPKTNKKKSFKMNKRLVSLPNLIKKSLNDPVPMADDSSDSKQYSQGSGDLELDRLYYELRQVVPIKNEMQANYKQEHREVQEDLVRRVDELRQAVVKRVIKMTK